MYCRWCEAIIAIVVFVFALWPTLFGLGNYSTWIVAIAAIVLFIHAFTCKRCMMCEEHMMASKKKRL